MDIDTKVKLITDWKVALLEQNAATSQRVVAAEALETAIRRETRANEAFNQAVDSCRQAGLDPLSGKVSP